MCYFRTEFHNLMSKKMILWKKKRGGGGFLLNSCLKRKGFFFTTFFWKFTISKIKKNWFKVESQLDKSCNFMIKMTFLVFFFLIYDFKTKVTIILNTQFNIKTMTLQFYKSWDFNTRNCHLKWKRSAFVKFMILEQKVSHFLQIKRFFPFFPHF